MFEKQEKEGRVIETFSLTRSVGWYKVFVYGYVLGRKEKRFKIF